MVSARTSVDVATYLHDVGHEVVVACPRPSRNIGTTTGPKYLSELTFPFDVKRLFAISSKKSTFASRFVENISFGFSIFLFLLTRRKVDVVYANVWPIFSLGLITLACRLRKIRLVASIQDLYPESLAVQNRISNQSLLYRSLYAMDSIIAKQCDHLLVISDGFKKSYLSRGIDPSQVTVLRNWVKSDVVVVIDKIIARSNLNKLLKLDLDSEDILCVYGGNIGVASGLDEFFKSLQYIDERVKFLLAGEGSLLHELKKQLQGSPQEQRIYFVSPWKSELTSDVLCSADILILPTAQGQEFASVPSKLITYMLSSRPIFLMADSRSESAAELTKARAGVVASNRDPRKVAESLNELVAFSTAIRNEMGVQGRNYAENCYSDKNALENINRILGAACES
ncbi:glycosyltransferase family 4 protein [Pseudomonas sp. NPDC089743]|uniref:glycosyltransferase family 4 protein n=1 Tax=Pseudomonas sp. NPDC089743 TaxID=3364471 RepID=UPI00382BD09F